MTTATQPASEPTVSTTTAPVVVLPVRPTDQDYAWEHDLILNLAEVA